MTIGYIVLYLLSRFIDAQPIPRYTLMEATSQTAEAIFTLLADDASDVRELMRTKLSGMPEAQLRQLCNESRLQPDHIAAELDYALHHSIWQRLTTRLLDWREQPMSLTDAMYFLCEFAHPDFDPAGIDSCLEDLADACRKELDRSDANDHLEKTNAIAQVLGDQSGFTGNQAEYYDPENSFIDSVLSQHVGIPISLSAIYLLVAQRLDVPLRGVGLPGHFIVLLESTEPPVAYDPFRRGMCLSYLDCIQLVEQSGHTFDDSQLKPVTPRYILVRSLNNLRHIYRRRKDSRRTHAIEQMLLTLLQTN